MSLADYCVKMYLEKYLYMKATWQRLLIKQTMKLNVYLNIMIWPLQW